MANNNSSILISQIYKSRKILLDILRYQQQYNIDEYANFSINEVNSMYLHNQLDMMLEKVEEGKTKKIYISYYLGKGLKPANILEMIDDLYNLEEILTPEEALFIREQLRVKLEMVKISLVQRNESLFQASLADVKKWTEQNFTKNTDDNSFLADLERLNITKISSQLPDISLSLKMIKDIATLRIETDKAIQPLDAMVTDKKTTLVGSNKPVETLAPAEAVEPSK